jgi:hypothetical protein
MCIKQRVIKAAYMGVCDVFNCADLKRKGYARLDGDYKLYPNQKCKFPITVYCHDMKTENPKEFLPLNAGAKNNYAMVYSKRLPPNSKATCTEKPDVTWFYSKTGITRFTKVRIDLKSMSIIADDYTFAKTDGTPVPFGTAGDCYSPSTDPDCRKGEFSIDLSGTGGISTQFVSTVKFRIHSAQEIFISRYPRN